MFIARDVFKIYNFYFQIDEKFQEDYIEMHLNVHHQKLTLRILGNNFHIMLMDLEDFYSINAKEIWKKFKRVFLLNDAFKIENSFLLYF